MKIPTILGLLILFLSSIIIVYGFFYLHKNIPKPKSAVTLTNLEQNNIGQDSITVSWQTNIPTNTELLLSHNPNMNPLIQDLKDNRDNDVSKMRLTHISTVNNLTPQSAYFIKIKIDGLLYPTADTQIKTLPNPIVQSNYNPIVGNVVDQNLQPINDALVFLLVPDSYPLSTGLSQGGNFILPLTMLANKADPSQPIDSKSLSSATLLIQKGDQKSEVTINISNTSQPLPPIVLGQNFDFRQQTSPSAFPQN